jgi:hypothetical protein
VVVEYARAYIFKAHSGGLFVFLEPKMPKPEKENAREYMEPPQGESMPPDDIREIRRQLGWNLVEVRRRFDQPVHGDEVCDWL